MSALQDYLAEKRKAVLQKQEEYRSQAHIPSDVIRAQVRAAGRSGVREIRINNFQVISDSPTDFAGHNLGPSSPELLLGVLGSCMTHITLIQAAEREIPLDSVEVEVAGEFHSFAGLPGYEEIPIYPHNITYTLKIASPEKEETITELYHAVESVCPILKLLVHPQTIHGQLAYTHSGLHSQTI